MAYLQQGKLNVGPIDATHGSSGKSKVADFIAANEDLDFAISHNSQNACLTEGHYAFTNRGIVDVADVADGFSEKALIGEKMMDITDRFKVGRRGVKRVILSNGSYFTGTPYHKFYVWDGKAQGMFWVSIDKLDPDTHQFVVAKNFPNLCESPVKIDHTQVPGVPGVPGVPNSKHLKSTPVEVDPNLAFILGLMVGGGNYNCDRKCSLAVDHDQFYNQDLFRSFISSLGINSTVRQMDDKKANYVEVHSTELLRLFRSVGLEKLSGAEKETPWSIMSSPKSVIAAYLAGLVESDGCVKDRVVVISNVSERLVRQAQVLCTYLGFRTKLRITSMEKSGYETSLSREAIYELSIGGYKCLKKFLELIPLTTKKKGLEELVIQKTGHGNESDSRVLIGDSTSLDDILVKTHPSSNLISLNYFYDIDSVIDAGEHEVYDFTVETAHSYVCNGTITHNSHVTVFDDGSSYKFNFLPSSVAKPGVKVVIGGDAVIDTKKALEEIEDWGLNEKNLYLHPLVTIIEHKDAQWEREHLAHMGSTMTGGGKAKADKIVRLKSVFAKDHPVLKKFVTNTHELVNNWLKEGHTGLLETAQGYDLSQDTIWTAQDGTVKTMYPYNTSRNINTSSYLGFSFVPPHLVGWVILNLRSFPIRVGDATTVEGDFVVKFEDGSEKGLTFSEFNASTAPALSTIQAKYPGAVGVIKLGSSGPVYDDQIELSWEEVTARSGSPTPIKEQTSLTKRVRRVFDRSVLQVRNSTMACMPSVISLNFANYLDHKIEGVSGKMSLGDLKGNWPKVAEYVEWVEENQFWAGTRYAGRVLLIGTGPKRSEMIELTGL